MDRRLLAVFALLASLLLLTTPTAVASNHNPSVASSHSTAAELGNASLENVTIEGSGNDASAVFQPVPVVDDGEDGDLAEYDGDLGRYSASTARSFSGSHSIEEDHTEATPHRSIWSTSGLATYPEAGDEFSYRLYQESASGSPDSWLHFGVQSGASSHQNFVGYGTRVDNNNNEIELWKDGSELASNSASIPQDEWLHAVVDWETDGTITFTLFDASGAEIASVQTQDTSYSSGGIGLTNNYAGAGSGSNPGSVFWDDIQIADERSSGSYIGDTHAASDVTTGWTNLTLDNATADVQWAADPDGDLIFEETRQDSFTSSGNQTVNVSGIDADEWRVSVDFETTGTDPTAELHDEGLLFEARDPTASGLQPMGEAQTGDDVTLSLNVADEDFATAQGDSVDVQFYVNGSPVGSDSLTTDATAETTVSDLDDGDYQWHAVLTDSYGSTTTTQTATFSLEHSTPTLTDPQPADGGTIDSYQTNLSIDVGDMDFGQSWGDNVSVTFHDVDDGSVIAQQTVSGNGRVNATWAGLVMGTNRWNVTARDEYGNDVSAGPFEIVTPSQLYIRDEETQQLLTGTQSNVTLTFFPEDGTEIVRRATDDGTVNLTGLPSDTTLLVQASADGYHTRQAIIRDITRQQTIYLLNESSPSVPVTFTLDDQTGDFPSRNTQLIVEKPVTINGSTEWRVLTADEFGVGGITLDLLEDSRYRLRVRNSGGDERVLGSYTATVSEVRELTVGSISWTIGDPGAERFTWEAVYFDDASADEFVRFSLRDQTGDLEDVELAIFERGNRSHELHNSTHFGPYGTLSVVEGPLNAGQRNTTWVVEWSAQRNGETLSGRTVVGSGEYPIGTSLDGRGLQLVAVLLIVFIAGFFPAAFAAIGAIVVSLAGLVLWSIGWLHLPLSWILAALAVGAIARGVKTGGFQS